MEEMDREFFKKYHRAVVKANAKEVEKVKSRIGSVWAEEFRARTGTRLEGEAFNQALLRIWLGDAPVQADLKKAMLGG